MDYPSRREVVGSEYHLLHATWSLKTLTNDTHIFEHELINTFSSAKLQI